MSRNRCLSRAIPAATALAPPGRRSFAIVVSRCPSRMSRSLMACNRRPSPTREQAHQIGLLHPKIGIRHPPVAIGRGVSRAPACLTPQPAERKPARLPSRLFAGTAPPWRFAITRPSRTRNPPPKRGPCPSYDKEKRIKLLYSLRLISISMCGVGIQKGSGTCQPSPGSGFVSPYLLRWRRTMRMGRVGW